MTSALRGTPGQRESSSSGGSGLSPGSAWGCAALGCFRAGIAVTGLLATLKLGGLLLSQCKAGSSISALVCQETQKETA